jgi:hypothetical protein
MRLPLDEHVRLFWKACYGAAWLLLAVNVLQWGLGLDFAGRPFLFFAAAVATFWVTIPIRLLIEKIKTQRG